MCITRFLASEYCRLVADTLRDCVAELRKGEEMRVSQCVHGEICKSDSIDLALS